MDFVYFYTTKAILRKKIIMYMYIYDNQTIHDIYTILINRFRKHENVGGTPPLPTNNKYILYI